MNKVITGSSALVPGGGRCPQAPLSPSSQHSSGQPHTISTFHFIIFLTLASLCISHILKETAGPGGTSMQDETRPFLMTKPDARCFSLLTGAAPSPLRHLSHHPRARFPASRGLPSALVALLPRTAVSPRVAPLSSAPRSRCPWPGAPRGGPAGGALSPRASGRQNGGGAEGKGGGKLDPPWTGCGIWVKGALDAM